MSDFPFQKGNIRWDENGAIDSGDDAVWMRKESYGRLKARLSSLRVQVDAFEEGRCRRRRLKPPLDTRREIARLGWIRDAAAEVIEEWDCEHDGCTIAASTLHELRLALEGGEEAEESDTP